MISTQPLTNPKNPFEYQIIKLTKDNNFKNKIGQ